MRTLRLGHEVANLMGVSVGKARQIASTDPDFPPVIVLGPRTKLVSEADLLRFVEGKKAPARSLVPEVKA